MASAPIFKALSIDLLNPPEAETCAPSFIIIAPLWIADVYTEVYQSYMLAMLDDGRTIEVIETLVCYKRWSVGVKTVAIQSPGDMGHAVGKVLGENGFDVITC